MALKTYTVYQLELPDGTFYAGCTQDLQHRLATHRRGTIGFSEHPYVDFLVLGEFATQEAAFEAEDKAIERLMRLGICANRKRSGTTSEARRAVERERHRRLLDGEKEMYGRTHVEALRKALNGVILVE